jgi:TRAP-type mannitol/chloroaromatic compound transport system permease small subunit
MQWHLYSSGFLIGLSYAYLDDKHIRVDILHERFSPELKAWVELYGTLVFLIPFLVLIIYFSIPFITSSYELSEISPSPGGLPFRWLIKSMLLIGFCVLFLAVASRLTRIWHFLFIGDQHAS